MAQEVILRAEHLSKKYGSKIVLDDFCFDIYKGEFLSLLGSSGCGKTTLLRLLVGIESPTSGRLFKYDEDVTELSPYERNIGIVFQNYALFPNMNVYDNIAYALSPKHLPKEEVNKRVMEMIDTVGLNDHIYKKPKALSGGQQQRVAIARTLITNPDVILFDEPMSALDANIKVVLRKELKDIQKKFGVTMVYVTHDQEEAFALSDRIMVIDDNQIVQIDKPSNIYKNPTNEFVKSFVTDQLDEKVRSILSSIKDE